MLTGLYGGTFDPVHRGHTHVAAAVRDHLNLDEVRLVLSARPGHRGAPRAPIEDRWHMLKLACARHEGLVADDSELRREGPSFTLVTVKYLRRTFPDIVPCWILGQDAFATLPEWHAWRELMAECNLVVVDRPGGRLTEPSCVRALCAAHEVSRLAADRIGQIVRLDLPMLDISASDIRHRVACGEPVEQLLESPVYSYIRQKQLYLEEAI